MKAIRYRFKLRKWELGVIINALNLEHKRLLQDNEPTQRTDALWLRLLDVYDSMKLKLNNTFT